MSRQRKPNELPDPNEMFDLVELRLEWVSESATRMDTSPALTLANALACGAFSDDDEDGTPAPAYVSHRLH